MSSTLLTCAAQPVSCVDDEVISAKPRAGKLAPHDPAQGPHPAALPTCAMRDAWPRAGKGPENNEHTYWSWHYAFHHDFNAVKDRPQYAMELYQQRGEWLQQVTLRATCTTLTRAQLDAMDRTDTDNLVGFLTKYPNPQKLKPLGFPW